MTPYELGLLIHFYCIAENHVTFGNPLYMETTQRFFSGGIIKDSERGMDYDLTELGVAWLTTILDTPIPEAAYLNALGKKIEIK